MLPLLIPAAVLVLDALVAVEAIRLRKQPCTRIGRASVPRNVAVRANQLLDGSGPDGKRLNLPAGQQEGDSTVETIDGVRYLFLAEVHPPDSGINAYHKGVTVFGCKEDGPKVGEMTLSGYRPPMPVLAAGAVGAGALVFSLLRSKL